jgi:hypothetical protein
MTIRSAGKQRRKDVVLSCWKVRLSETVGEPLPDTVVTTSLENPSQRLGLLDWSLREVHKVHISTHALKGRSLRQVDRSVLKTSP